MVHVLSLPIPVSFPVLRVISSGSVNGKIAVSYQITAIMFFSKCSVIKLDCNIKRKAALLQAEVEMSWLEQSSSDKVETL